MAVKSGGRTKPARPAVDQDEATAREAGGPPEGDSADTSPNDSGLRTPTPQTVRQKAAQAASSAAMAAPQAGPSRPSGPARGLLSFSRPRGDAGITPTTQQQPAPAPKAAVPSVYAAGSASNKYGYTSPPRPSSRRLSAARKPSANEAAPAGRGRAIPFSRPPANPAGTKGVIASSLDLVFSYSRSQAFFGDNLPSSPSFVARYRRPGYREGDEEEGYSSFVGTESEEESEEEEEGESEDVTDDIGHTSLADSQSPERGEEEAAAVEPEALPPNATQRAIPKKRKSQRQPSVKVADRPLVSSPTATTAEERGRTTSDEASSAYDADDNSEPAAPSERTRLLAPLPDTSFSTTDEADEADYGTLPRRTSGANPPRPSKKLLQDAQVIPPDDQSRTPPFANSSQISARLIGSAIDRDPWATGSSTFGQTLFNSFNVLCGVGILSEPLAFASAGWVGGGVLLAFCGLITNYTAKVLARILLEDRTLLTYNDIGIKAFGSGIRYFISFLFCLELTALAVALVIIFADSFSTLFPAVSLLTFKFVAFFVILPTVFLPLRLLSYTSLIGLLGSLVLVTVVVIDGAIKTEAPGSLRHPAETNVGPSQAWGLSAGLIMSGFSGHAVMPSLARDMRQPRQFNRMVDIAYVLAGAMYLIMAVVGYLMFGQSVSNEITRDILATHGYPRVLNKISVWMVAINPIAKFALGTRPLNTTVEHLLGIAVPYPQPPTAPSSPRMRRRRSSTYSSRGRQLGANGTTNSSSTLKLRGATGRRSSSAPLLSPNHGDSKLSAGPPEGASTFSRVSAVLAAQKERTKALIRVALRVGMTAAIVAIAIVLPDFDRVMSFLGAFSAFVICVIMPLCAKIRIYGGRNLGRVELGLDIVLLVISVVMAGIGTVFTFLPNRLQ